MPRPSKIAVAGATGRVGRHTVEVLEAAGHGVVPMSRSTGVDVVTGEGLSEALTGVDCVVDAASWPSSEQGPATGFLTAAARVTRDRSAPQGGREPADHRGPRSPAGTSSTVETVVSMLGLRERRRLERDLHDGAQQRLVSLALTLRMTRDKLGPDAGEAGRLLDRSQQELDEALKELRELARGIHPTVLSEQGLGAAVESLAHRAPLPVEVGEWPAQELPEQVELAVYFVISEALTNVAKYASATQASVTMTKDNGRLAVEISDDGVGGADIDLGTGLRGLTDRLAAIDGQLEVDSEPGRGTTVRASIPCP
jgi:signal transduction histidine kinase